MAEVLPTPDGPQDDETTLRLRIDATRLGELELSVLHVLHCLYIRLHSKATIQDIAREKLIMSETLKERVRKHLEAGGRPTLKGRRVVLKDVVLVRADGRETPVAQEARRLKPHINLSF